MLPHEQKSEVFENLVPFLLIAFLMLYTLKIFAFLFYS